MESDILSYAVKPNSAFRNQAPDETGARPETLGGLLNGEHIGRDDDRVLLRWKRQENGSSRMMGDRRI
ncbi:hypothetical protein [Actinoplanes sp. N902-109]|uniref:hypothetical protein n=1 Tax=Actinoplanes sp. (strain N902-109) TaxID=649831 RepID=UPI001E5C752B|nr:hypothetical protein [Actinoplanes sp. N902-109]